MVESAARRDRVDSQAVSAWYLWEPPAKPACVYLSFDLIDKLEREVVENFRSLTSRGSEVGGILLGAVAPGSPAGISVEAYEAIPCDYSRGPLYRLSDADLGRFERAMEQRSSAGNVQVVGFFRSHTRKGLTLDAEDLAFLEAKFRNPYAMALLVRPFATKASVAGIFLRESSGFTTEASALEFPFRSSELTPSKRAPEPAPAAAAPPTRAQVVPIATRREISPAPSSTAPAAQPAAEPAKTAAPEAKIPAAPAPQASPAETKPAGPPSNTVPPPKSAPAPGKNALPQGKNSPPAKNVPPPVKTPAPPVQDKARDAAVAQKADAPKAEPPKPQPPKAEPAKAAAKAAPAVAPPEEKTASKVPLLTGGLAAALLIFVLLFVYPGFLHRSQRGAASTAQDSSPLTLRVEHTGTDLLLTWNRDSAAIRNATSASLAITDGDRHENYDMDLAQLRTGSIVYSPLGGDVSFQMEVIGKDKSRTATETLRLLQTRPSPMPNGNQDESKGGKNANNAQTTTAAQPNASAPTTSETKTPEATPAEEAKPAAPPLTAFDASSLSQRLRPARAADLADLPTPAPSAVGAPKVNSDGTLPFASMPSAPVAPPQAPARPAAQTPAPQTPAAQTSAKSNSSSGGQIQAAQLISRKEPEYPLLARQMGAKGSVELIATIGEDGTVKKVKVVKGHPLLVKAAEDAVMQWRYRPTLLNGVPVQNDTKITLNFVPQQ